MKIFFFAFLTSISIFQISHAQDLGTQLLRQPAVFGDHVVFVYANDLWKTSIRGGDALRLTSNEGYESFPHFSNDGSKIAFTAEYGGNVDVFVIHSDGGEPKRLTWHPGPDIVQGWTPDGKVMFRSGRQSHPTQTNKFYTVSITGGLPEALDIPRAAYGDISPDGKQIAYVPITSWDPEWRNYRGGQAMPIWIVDIQNKNLTRTPQLTRERHLDPVWFDNKVFYLSERDFASNIWSYDPQNHSEKQITFHKKFDVKSLDASEDAIVYEQGGYLHYLNPNSLESRQLKISVRGDMNFARSRWEKVSGNELTNPYISPTGKRAIFESRGEIFSIPKENGTWRNISNDPGAADRFPCWSPKGDKIAWFSDQSGEYQLVIADQTGKINRMISIADPTFYFSPQWSPDGKLIAFSDTHYNIKIADVNTGLITNADTDGYAHPNRTMNPAWSPDSKWIAYPKQLDSHYKAIFAYNIITKKSIQLTDGMADAVSPVWDQNGKFLYFLASTNYGLNSGWLDMSSYDPDVTRNLYCMVLLKNGKAPNLPKSDEETGDKDEKKEDANDEKKISVVIHADGIQKRIVALDLEEGNYISLRGGPEHKVFVAEGNDEDSDLTIHQFDVEEMKSEEYASGVSQYITSFDGAHILINQNGGWILSSTDGKPDKDADNLKMDLKIKIDPQSEYHQIFREGWRYMRDFLYVDNVHGAPWDKVYDWYAPWINHVRHRTDLNYVVDIMSGEVSIGHSYVRGGDMPDISNVPVGLLGCDFTIHEGHYKIYKIYNGESWNPEVKAPLSLPGMGIEEGDIIHAINGHNLDSNVNPYSLLEQTADRETVLTISKTSSIIGAKEIIVKPVRSERDLRYWDWIEGNRRKVSELSADKLAYVYVPNTGAPGFTNFNRFYFSQQDKKGVIIDERNNGGGSAADYMIDIMSREIFGYFNSKAGDKRPWTSPISGIWGPKVMIINERAGSGGDLLPYMFHAKELGPLVGTRTWGGLVGTWDTPPFIDGGRMVAPRGGFYDKEGNWAVEGDGIAPDIEVIQEPKLVLEGRDPQLERAVEEALKMLEEHEFHMKPEPAPPVKWKRPKGFQE